MRTYRRITERADQAERRLSQVLLYALELTCQQGDIDMAREVNRALEAEVRRRPISAPECREQWPVMIERGRASPQSSGKLDAAPQVRDPRSV